MNIPAHTHISRMSALAGLDVRAGLAGAGYRAWALLIALAPFAGLLAGTDETRAWAVRSAAGVAALTGVPLLAAILGCSALTSRLPAPLLAAPLGRAGLVAGRAWGAFWLLLIPCAGLLISLAAALALAGESTLAVYARPDPARLHGSFYAFPDSDGAWLDLTKGHVLDVSLPVRAVAGERRAKIVYASALGEQLDADGSGPVLFVDAVLPSGQNLRLAEGGAGAKRLDFVIPGEAAVAGNVVLRLMPGRADLAPGLRFEDIRVQSGERLAFIPGCWLALAALTGALLPFAAAMLLGARFSRGTALLGGLGAVIVCLLAGAISGAASSNLSADYAGQVEQVLRGERTDAPPGRRAANSLTGSLPRLDLGEAREAFESGEAPSAARMLEPVSTAPVLALVLLFAAWLSLRGREEAAMGERP